MPDAKLLPQITQIMLFLAGLTESSPLYRMYFGAAFQHHLPQGIFWARILCFCPPRVSLGASEPANSAFEPSPVTR